MQGIGPYVYMLMLIFFVFHLCEFNVSVKQNSIANCLLCDFAARDEG